ncbi:MAG: calcineurin-like phosphoesterase C-terminal domain-containing protein [Candidatus Cryptobacteroides sp.]
MKRFLSFFVLLALCLPEVLSCSEKEEGGSGGEIDVQFSVPDNITVEDVSAGITFKVLFSKAPLKTDKIVLQDATSVAHDCAITTVSSSSFTISLYDGICSGRYSVSVKRGSQVRKMGETDITVDNGTEVKPESGSTVYGIVTCGGKGMPGVVISDGVEVVQTDPEGVYQMKSAKKYGYVFISIPSGYEVANNGILPRNYIKLVKSSNVVERVDFQVFKAGDQTNHNLLVLGDMHLAGGRNNDVTLFGKFCSEINEYTAAHRNEKTYAITLGDMTWDYYWYDNNYQFAQYLNDANKMTDLMVFHTIGNHDHDMFSVGDFDTIQQYTELVSPDYYSFNIGNIHYMVLDNIECTNNGKGKDYRTYNQKVTDEQLEWIKKDLSFVSTSTPVVVAMHSPTFNMSAADKANLTSLFSAYDQVHFITGHTHKVANQSVSNYKDHNSGAICADWWSSVDLAGLHIAQDGAPGGYQIFNISGKDFKWQFKPTGISADLQFRTYDRNCINLSAEKMMPDVSQTYKDAYETLAGQWTKADNSNEVYINVWNFGDGWKIEVTEDGKALAVTGVSSVRDPLHILTYSAVKMKTSTSPTFKTSVCSHLWKVTASSATSTLNIKVTDCFGNVYTETMTRPKAFTVDTYK